MGGHAKKSDGGGGRYAQRIALRLAIADRLRCRLSDLDNMAVAEFDLMVEGYIERNRRDDDLD